MVATPISGQLSVSVQKADTVGDVQPVYISIANGTDIPRAVVPSQIFAINGSDERVAPLAPGEAARQAGGAGELKAALVSGAISGGAAGALGAGVGAAAGAATGGIGVGSMIGAAIGGFTGLFEGASRGQEKADLEAREQLSAVALRSQDVRRDFTAGGYVFFPKGDYQKIQLLLVNSETGDTETLERPWP